MNVFSELTNQVHYLNDLILADMIYDHENYAQESLDFNKHLLATKSWFMRISYANKKRYLVALLNDVRRAWTISLLLKSIWNCRPKDSVMSICQSEVWSSYDRPPMDHNRTATSIKTLAQSMINDRKWFLSLDPECQALMLTDLLTVSGGPVVWEVYRRAHVIYDRYRERQFKSLLDCIVVPDEKGETKQGQAAPAMQESKTDQPKTPSAIQAQKQLDAADAAWKAKIKQIRDSQKLEEVEMTFKDGTKNKIWKVNRPRPEGIETVDFVQLLPAVVGMKILSYLPKNELDNYVKVNRYWAFLIDEYKNQLEARHQLISNLGKLQESMLDHDVSLEVLIAPADQKQSFLSGGPSLTTSLKTKNPASCRASEKSMFSGFSFKHFLGDKLRNKIKKQRPIRNLRDLTDRLEMRGAADAHLWCWCQNVIKQAGPEQVTKKDEEGVLRFKDIHFPCPFMKCSLDVPLQWPLSMDPTEATSKFPKLKRNMSNTTLPGPPEPEVKRYHLWSRNFSELYKAYKIPSYQSPF